MIVRPSRDKLWSSWTQYADDELSKPLSKFKQFKRKKCKQKQNEKKKKTINRKFNSWKEKSKKRKELRELIVIRLDIAFTWLVHLRTILDDYPVAPMQLTIASVDHRTNYRILCILSESIVRYSAHCRSASQDTSIKWIAKIFKIQCGRKVIVRWFSAWSEVNRTIFFCYL